MSLERELLDGAERRRSPVPPPAHPSNDYHENCNEPPATSACYPETPWFYDMAFRGYWDHWRHIQSWLNAAQYAYGKADKARSEALRQWHNGSSIGDQFGLPSGFPSGVRTDDPTSATAKERRHKMRAERKKRQKLKKKKRERKARSDNMEETEMEEEDDYEEIETPQKPKSSLEAACDDQDEFLNLLAQNHAFRQKRDAYKREEEEKAQRKEFLSSRTPVEQAGSKRTREMCDLYGGESILIQTMETNLQMKFDEFSDSHKPPLWPSIPLNLGYGR